MNEDGDYITFESVFVKIINAALWLIRIYLVLTLIVLGLCMFFDGKSNTLSGLLVILAGILALPLIPEKIIRKKMTPFLRFIYTCTVFCFCLWVGSSMA